MSLTKTGKKEEKKDTKIKGKKTGLENTNKKALNIQKPIKN
jgi:hypothetical protein